MTDQHLINRLRKALLTHSPVELGRICGLSFMTIMRVNRLGRISRPRTRRCLMAGLSKALGIKGVA